MFKSINFSNFLSFNDKNKPIELKNLNIIIGTNGSGKSNFIEGFSLLKATTVDLRTIINKGGGVKEWIWKGSKETSSVEINAIMEKPFYQDILTEYCLGFEDIADRFEIVKEIIKETKPRNSRSDEPYLYYENINDKKPTINVKESNGVDTSRSLRREDVSSEKSILVQRRDPNIYPELTRIANDFSKIMIYRNISTDRDSAIRNSQLTDLPTDLVLEDSSNLALILNNIDGTDAYNSIIEEISQIYPGVEGISCKVQSNRITLYLKENIGGKHTSIPSTRLSDGTLQYLFLLTILLSPIKPPLICLEEPEMGLHPDLIHKLAHVLKKSSEHTQIIITTHSKNLVDAFNDDPESVIICEKVDGATQLKRLDEKKLESWLKKYSLGTLWERGDLGGNIW